MVEKVFECVIPSRPVPKARPRVTFQHGRAQTYTPRKSKNYAEWASYVMLSEAAEQGFVTILRAVPVAVTLYFVLNQLPQKIPDIANLTMQLADAMTGVLIEDDCQIVECVAYKMQADEEYVRVEIRA